MSPIKNNRVYLTDGMMRRTLAATRALGKEGVLVTCGEESKFNPTFYSRHCHETDLYPSPRNNPQQFIQHLLHYLRQNPHEYLIPMEQDTLDLVMSHRHQFEQVTQLPFADFATYSIFRDKSRTMALAEQEGLPHPRTVQPKSLESLLDDVQSLRFPVVIKPRYSWGSRGIRFIDTPEDLVKEYRLVHEEDPLPIVQEQIPQGDKYYVCCLMDDEQNLVAHTIHKELRNYPLRNGPSTAQQTVDWPELKEITEKLLRAGKWYGVANSDFMIDPRDGTPMLMEVNPRFWGPLQASIQAGVNFPYLLVRLARGEEVEIIPDFSVDEVCRAFLPYDLIHFLANPKRFQMNPSFFKFWGRKIRYDILSWRDPMPTFGFFLTVLRFAADPEIWIRQARMEKAGRLMAKILGKKVTDFNAQSSQSTPV